jgi:hypothetical protein
MLVKEYMATPRSGFEAATPGAETGGVGLFYTAWFLVLFGIPTGFLTAPVGVKHAVEQGPVAGWTSPADLAEAVSVPPAEPECPAIADQDMLPGRWPEAEREWSVCRRDLRAQQAAAQAVARGGPPPPASR